MNKLTHILAILTLLFAYGCAPHSHDEHGGHNHGEAEHAHEEEGHNEDASESGTEQEEVHLIQKQMDVMGIEMGEFQFLNLSTTVKSNGQLELPPQNKASLSSLLGGRVKSIDVLEGDYVSVGQTLATLEHPDFVEMQQQYMTTKSRLTFLETDYQRKKSLFADSISSEKSFQKAKAEYLSVLATANGLKAKLQLMNIDPASAEKGDFLSSVPVRSPINGYVRLIEVNMGKYVQPEQEMFEIVDNDHIHIDLMIYEKDMDKVKKGQKVIFSLSNNPDQIFEGSIFSLGKSFEREPKAMVLHAEISNRSGNLLPGMYVDARIITNDEKVQCIPNDALVSDGGLSYIFVLKTPLIHKHEDGEEHTSNEGHEGEFLFRKIEVNTGATDIGFTEVVPAYNLPEDVKVVTKGAFYLLAEMKKGEGGHGHHH